MTLIDAVATFHANPASLRPAPLPPTPAVAKAARELATRARFDSLAEIEEFDRDALLAKLHQARASGDWSPISRRDLRFAPRVLWLKPSDMDALAGDTAFLRRYLEAVDRAESRSALRALAREYLRRFEPGLAGKVMIGQALLLRRPALNKPWDEAECAKRLFDAGDGGRLLGQLALDDPEGTLKVLDRHGLGGARSNAGIAASAFQAALETLRTRLERSPDQALLERILGWAVAEDGKLRYARQRQALADALLLPWVAHDPDPAMRKRIEGFLLDHFQDPRLFHNVWQGVHDEARAVILHWLAKASLETFLRVFDRHAEDHQWRYRRAFWTAYADRGYVRNAQVVFAPPIAKEAQQLARQTKDPSLGHFALLRPAPLSNHAVLLLEIGDLVVADWSHNGKLRIWRRQDPVAPHLDRREYQPDELRRLPKRTAMDDFLEVTHWPQGSWQQQAHDFIARHTRIRLHTRDFMPDR